MKRLALVGIILLFSSCIEDEGGCVRVSPFGGVPFTSKASKGIINEQLLLEYIDTDGENIFENGSYDPDGVTLNKNGELYTDVVDLYNEETKYLIWVGGYSEGKNLFAVSLAPTSSRIDHLTVYATLLDFDGCTGPSVAIDSVFYNEEKQTLKKLSAGLKKLTLTQ